MNDLEQTIKRINGKLQRLVKDYQLLLKENQRKTALIEALQKAKDTNTAQINSLQEQVGILKAATRQMNETDKKAFEKTIGQYIKEIDKCIDLLSA